MRWRWRGGAHETRNRIRAASARTSRGSPNADSAAMANGTGGAAMRCAAAVNARPCNGSLCCAEDWHSSGAPIREFSIRWRVATHTHTRHGVCGGWRRPLDHMPCAPPLSGDWSVASRAPAVFYTVPPTGRSGYFAQTSQHAARPACSQPLLSNTSTRHFLKTTPLQDLSQTGPLLRRRESSHPTNKSNHARHRFRLADHVRRLLPGALDTHGAQ